MSPHWTVTAALDGWPLAVTLAMAVFDGGRLARRRPGVAALPLAAYCCVPLATSLSNGLGVSDGLSGVACAVSSWGLPYLAGRLYCSTPDGLRRLTTVLVCGGLVYVPLCLWRCA